MKSGYLRGSLRRDESAETSRQPLFHLAAAIVNDGTRRNEAGRDDPPKSILSLLYATANDYV
jgi:hypothetical protein